MNRFELDDQGRHLLRLLQEDANRTLHDLGEAVGLSGPAVQRRLARYRAAGILRRTVAQIDPTQIGGALTVLNLAILERDKGPAVARLRTRIVKHPHVQQCYELAGSFDLATILVVPDMDTYRRVAEELFGSDENVRRFVTHVSLGTIKAGLTVPL